MSDLDTQLNALVSLYVAYEGARDFTREVLQAAFGNPPPPLNKCVWPPPEITATVERAQLKSVQRFLQQNESLFRTVLRDIDQATVDLEASGFDVPDSWIITEPLDKFNGGYLGQCVVAEIVASAAEEDSALEEVCEKIKKSVPKLKGRIAKAEKASGHGESTTQTEQENAPATGGEATPCEVDEKAVQGEDDDNATSDASQRQSDHAMAPDAKRRGSLFPSHDPTSDSVAGKVSSSAEDFRRRLDTIENELRLLPPNLCVLLTHTPLTQEGSRNSLFEGEDKYRLGTHWLSEGELPYYPIVGPIGTDKFPFGVVLSKTSSLLELAVDAEDCTWLNFGGKCGFYVSDTAGVRDSLPEGQVAHELTERTIWHYFAENTEAPIPEQSSFESVYEQLLHCYHGIRETCLEFAGQLSLSGDKLIQIIEELDWTEVLLYLGLKNPGPFFRVERDSVVRSFQGKELVPFGRDECHDVFKIRPASVVGATWYALEALGRMVRAVDEPAAEPAQPAAIDATHQGEVPVVALAEDERETKDGYVDKQELDAVAGNYVAFKTIQNKNPGLPADITGSNNRSLYSYLRIRALYVTYDPSLDKILPKTFSEFRAALQSVQSG